MKKHINYFDLLSSCAEKGCPICRLGQKAVKSYLDILLFECVTDPEIGMGLRASLGYCHRHAWLLPHIGQGNLSGIAMIYRDLLGVTQKMLTAEETAQRRFAWLRGILRRWRRRPARPAHGVLQPQKPCPACLEYAETERQAIAVLLTTLRRSDEQLLHALHASDGLCLPHLRDTLATASDAATYQTVLTLTQAHLARLIGDVDEFLRKHDYRFSHEEIGAEGDSWERALRFSVGLKDGEG